MPLTQDRSATQVDIESLTIHGLSRVASANNKYTRMIWLVLCISAATSFGIVAANSIIKYYQYQTFTYNTVRPNNKLALPAITFCHTGVHHLLTSMNEDLPVFQDFPKNCSFNDKKYFPSAMNLIIFQIACRMFIGTLKLRTLAMGTNIPQYFRFPEGFQIAPYAQPCVTLNRNSSLVQQAAGEKYGLHMIMYNEDYNSSYALSRGGLLTDNRIGVYAIIHDRKQLVPMGDGIVIPPGYHTHISVTKNVFKRLPHPYPSKCKNGWSDRDSIYPGKNTQHMCSSSCALKKLYGLCPGVIPEMRVFMKGSEFPVQADTDNASFWECIVHGLAQINYKDCDCRDHCDDETYTTVINRNPWPQHWHASSFMQLINDIEGKTNRSLSKADIRERLMKVSIYYNEFRETFSEERPVYDLVTIASNLGGQMGLFMGASLLSLAEVIALVAQRFKRFLCKCDKSTETSPQPISERAL